METRTRKCLIEDGETSCFVVAKSRGLVLGIKRVGWCVVQ